MKTGENPSISRRRFIASSGAAASVALFAPRQIVGENEGLVQKPDELRQARR
jgi:hypothetical protein